MRVEFNKATKAIALELCRGFCDRCGDKLSPGFFHFDHVIPAWYGNPNPGIQVLCVECHKDKTAKDVKLIFKSKRIIKRHKGIRKPRTIRGWRRFDGTPVKATKER